VVFHLDGICCLILIHNVTLLQGEKAGLNMLGLSLCEIYDIIGRKETNMSEMSTREAEMVRLYAGGETLQYIGEQFGITRERVRQIVHKADKSARDKHLQIVEERRLQRKLAKQPTVYHLVCRVDDKPFDSTNPHKPTCSVECSRVWRLSRRLLDPFRAECQRISIARNQLRHPEQVPAHQLKVARAIVEAIDRGEVRPLRFYMVDTNGQSFKLLVQHFGSIEKAMERVQRTQDQRSSPEVVERLVKHYNHSV